MDKFTALRKEEARVNSLMAELRDNPIFLAREEWKALGVLFSTRFNSFDVEQKFH